MVSSMPRPHFTPGKDPVPILQEAGWAPGPVWTGGKSRPHRDSIPDRTVRSSVAIPTELPGPYTYIYYPAIHASVFLVLFFPQFLPTKTLYIFLFSPKTAASPAHLILLDTIARKISDDVYTAHEALHYANFPHVNNSSKRPSTLL